MSPSVTVRKLAAELVHRAQSNDPVRGRWQVNPHGDVTVWTDASSLAMGVVIQVDDAIVEDSSWLRKKSDSLHINVAELEAVGRGINLAVQWGFKAFTVATDSRTVLSWMGSAVDGRDRVRTKSAAQLLIKRRLMVIKEVIAEYQLAVEFRFVTTIENKADQLTRVANSWLTHRESGDSHEDESVPMAAISTGRSLKDAIWAAHLPHHLGVDRTFYLAKRIKQGLTRDQVKRAITGCETCQRIDPAVRSENLIGQGDLAVEQNWCRVAADVTHYKGTPFLSLVDCGPSRIAIWRRLRDETAASIVADLQQLVIERGPFAELLLDNSTAFRSAAVRQFATTWGISLRFRAAYAPSGNGIVERNHRTIKRIAARGDITPELATFWYNVTPRKAGDGSFVPSRQQFRYLWRLPYDINTPQVDSHEGSAFVVGEKVWVKPAVPSCTKRWASGRVTEVQSTHVICVDGMPRHVRDVRKHRGRDEDSSDQAEGDSASDGDSWPDDCLEDVGRASNDQEQQGVRKEPPPVVPEAEPECPGDTNAGKPEGLRGPLGSIQQKKPAELDLDAPLESVGLPHGLLTMSSSFVRN